MISLLIFKRPYDGGKPFTLSTVIWVSPELIEEESAVDPTITSGIRLSNFRYWSKFSAISTVPPWYSCEM